MVADGSSGPVEGDQTEFDAGWLRDELLSLRSQLEGIEAGLANQRSAFIDIAGARTLELRDALGEVRSLTMALQGEAARMRDLQEAVAGRLNEVVVDAIRPQLDAAMSGQFPRLVVEALAPALRQALVEWLPGFVADAVRPEVRASLDERLGVVVADALSPEVRRTLGERLPGLVVDVVRPELRQTIADQLPTIIAQAVGPQVGELLVHRLPSLVAEAVNPEMSVTLAGIEGCAAELRNEAARMRSLREVIVERLPEATMTVVEPYLREALTSRLPADLAAALAPSVQASLAGHLPALLSDALSPEVRRTVASQLPELIARSIEPELRSVMTDAIGANLGAMVAGTVAPEVRAALDETVPELVASALLAGLSEVVASQLPAAISQAMGPDLSVSLADVEGCASALRDETTQLRNLREALAQRMPEALVSSIQPVFEDLLSVRLPAMMSEILGPSLDEALVGVIAGRVAAELASEGMQAQPAAARIEASLIPIREESVRLKELRDELAHDLPALVARSVREELAKQQGIVAALAPPVAPPPAVTDPTSEAGDADSRSADDPAAGEGSESDEGVPAQVPAVGAPSQEEADKAKPAKEPEGGDGGSLDEDLSIACVLPGLTIGPSLGLGVRAALTRARVRRRRRRPAGPPAPGLHCYDPYVSYTIRSLERYALGRQATEPAGPGADGEIGSVAVGECGGREVSLALGSGGFAVTGPRSRDVARAVVLSLLAGNESTRARAIVVGELLPPSSSVPGLTRARDIDGVLDGLEAEAHHRRQLLADASAEDLESYRIRRPDDPLPFLLLVTGDLSVAHHARLESVLEDGVETGIATLLVDTNLEGLTELRISPELTIGSVIPEAEAGELIGARLFTVEREAASDLLGVLANARTDVEDEDAPPTPDAPFAAMAVEAPIIDVQLLGAFRLEAGGREVRSGLRAKARELLAFYLLHPEGTGLEEATEALWPEADPRRGSEWFWTALGNLRSRLRKATGESDLKVIEREGDRYRIEPVFKVDLWSFQAGLAEAAERSGDPDWADVLEQTVALCPGELLATTDWAWASVPRDDLRFRLVDLLVSLAATRLVQGDVKGALQALQQAVDTDPFAEQLYRRIMRLHAKMSRPDEVESTFRTLAARMTEIGLYPTTESESLRSELSPDPA